MGALHRLAPAHRAATPEEVAASLIGLHATDPAAIYLAVLARTAGAGATVADVDRALYDDRSLVRVMAMRRTMWAVPAELVPIVVGAAGRAVAAKERRALVKLVEEQGVAGDGDRFVAHLTDAALAALADRGEAMTADLSRDVPDLARTIRTGGNSKWATDVSLATRVVLLLTCEGRIMRTRPLGSWTSTRHRYAVAPLLGDPLEPADAEAELARRWTAAFGAASAGVAGDLMWWAGWTVAQTTRALAAAGDDVDAVAAADPGPWAALVPALDPTTMGWKDRSWYLGELGSRLFDRNGNAGPAIWWSGRIVGGWAQRPTGEVVTRLLIDEGRDAAAAVEAEAARLQAWLDASGGRYKPRFPTPLQQELERQ